MVAATDPAPFQGGSTPNSTPAQKHPLPTSIQPPTAAQLPLPLPVADLQDAGLDGQHRPTHQHCLLSMCCSVLYSTYAIPSTGAAAPVLAYILFLIAL